MKILIGILLIFCLNIYQYALYKWAHRNYIFDIIIVCLTLYLSLKLILDGFRGNKTLNSKDGINR
jgi:hypothetical protein